MLCRLPENKKNPLLVNSIGIIILKCFKRQLKPGPADLWRIHDYLTKQRKQTDKKYDFRYSVLILVFAMLLKEGWLNEADLQGLREDKIEKIEYLATMHLRKEHQP